MLQNSPIDPNVVQAPPIVVQALLLDDSAFDRTRIRRVSRNAEIMMEIEEVPTIADMKAAVNRTDFDLIMIDYRLTDGNGLEALEFCENHARTQNAAKIMIAGAAKTNVVVSAMQNGCHNFIAKEDLSPEMMRDAVQSALRRAGKLPMAAPVSGAGNQNLPSVHTVTGFDPEALQAAMEDSVKTGIQTALKNLGLGERYDEAMQTEVFLTEFFANDEFDFKH